MTEAELASELLPLPTDGGRGMTENVEEYVFPSITNFQNIFCFAPKFRIYVERRGSVLLRSIIYYVSLLQGQKTCFHVVSYQSEPNFARSAPQLEFNS